jgi:hypothetical protein
MKIVVTAKELLDNYSWDVFCELRGINPWAVNEGMPSDTEFELSSKEAYALGFTSEEPEEEEEPEEDIIETLNGLADWMNDWDAHETETLRKAVEEIRRLRETVKRLSE